MVIQVVPVILDSASPLWYGEVMERKYVYSRRPGITRTLIIDDERPWEPTVLTTQDNMEEVLASITRDRDLHRDRTTNKLVARVPVEVYELSVHQDWDENDWKKWLNDPDNQQFRIWQGRV